MATDSRYIELGFGTRGDAGTFVAANDTTARSRDGRIELDFAENKIGRTQIKTYDNVVNRGKLSINTDTIESWMIRLPAGASLQSVKGVTGTQIKNVPPMARLRDLEPYTVASGTVFSVLLDRGQGAGEEPFTLAGVGGGEDLTAQQLAEQINSVINSHTTLRTLIRAWRSSNHGDGNTVEVYLLRGGSNSRLALSGEVSVIGGSTDWVSRVTGQATNPYDGSVWGITEDSILDFDINDWTKISVNNAEREVWEYNATVSKSARNELNPAFESHRQFSAGRFDATGTSRMMDDLSIEVMFDDETGSVGVGGIHFDDDEFRGAGVSSSSPIRLVSPFSLSEKRKLESIEAGAEPNVQPDALTTDETSDSYIRNFPDYLRNIDFPVVVSTPETLAEMVGAQLGALFNNRYYAASEIVNQFAPGAPENVKIEAMRLIIIHLSKTNWVAYDSVTPSDLAQDILRLSGADKVLSGWLLSDAELEVVQVRQSFIGLLSEYLLPRGRLRLDQDPDGVELYIDPDNNKVNLDLENVPNLTTSDAQVFRNKIRAPGFDIADNRAFFDLSNVDLDDTADDILRQLGTRRFTDSDRATLNSLSSGEQIVAGDAVETPVPLLAGGNDRLTGYVSPPAFDNFKDGKRADGQTAVIGRYGAPLALTTGAAKRYIKILVQRVITVDSESYRFLNTAFIYPERNGQFNTADIFVTGYIQTNILGFIQGHIIMKCIDDGHFILGATDVGDTEVSSFIIKEMSIGH